MKRLLIILFIVSSQSLIFCQTENYDISQYLFSDFQRKTLRIDPQLNFNFRNSDLIRSYSNGNIGISAFGTEISNSRKRQLYIDYRISAGYQFYSDDHPITGQETKFNASAGLNLENRFFFKPKRFFEIAGGASFAYDPNYLNYGANRKEIDIAAGLSPRVGFGRIENVSDAWHAVTIIEELQKAGCIEKQLSHEEITVLADELRKLKNVRNVDFRLEDIYEFEQLAKYLVENGYASGKDYRFFALLDDAYAYEDFTFREQGQALTIGADFSADYLDTDFTSKRTITDVFYALVVGFEKNNAISTDWQFDQKYELSGGVNTWSPLTTEDFNSDSYIALATEHLLGYYLSQRTYFAVPLHTEIRKISDDLLVNVGLYPTLNYYFSPQLRFTVRGQFSLYNDNLSINNGIANESATLSAGVNYFFY